MSEYSPRGDHVDGLIDALETDGTLDSAGRFTLDATVAREKLARFQLEEPARYVLMLLRAAVRQGASRADFRIDADSLRLTFDGSPFPAAALGNLWGSLLDGDVDGAPRSGLVELAVALASAEAFGMKEAEIRSGDGATGSVLRLRGDAPPALEPLPAEEPLAGTSLVVRLAGGTRAVGRALADYAGALPEEVLLRREAIHAPLRLTLDGRRIPTTPDPSGVLALVPVVDEETVDGAPAFHGAAGLETGCLEPAVLRVVKDGILVEEHALKPPLPGFGAVVHADGLTTDLSQFQLVRDAAWERLLAATLKAQRESLLDLARQMTEAAPGQAVDRDWSRAVLHRAMAAIQHADDLLGPGADPALGALGDVPLWAAVETAQTRAGRCALRPLLEHVKGGGRVLWFDLTPDEMVEGWPEQLGALQERWCLFAPDGDERAVLVRTLGDGLRPLFEAENALFSRIYRAGGRPRAQEWRWLTKDALTWIVLGLLALLALLTLVHFAHTG